MKKMTLIPSITGLGMVLAGCVSHKEASSDRTKAERPAVQAVFNEKGEAVLPKGYRSWVHVSTSWLPITTSLLDGMITKTPELFNTYVEPSAFQTYVKTGEWPDGTLLAKEFTATAWTPSAMARLHISASDGTARQSFRALTPVSPSCSKTRRDFRTSRATGPISASGISLRLTSPLRRRGLASNAPNATSTERAPSSTMYSPSSASGSTVQETPGETF